MQSRIRLGVYHDVRDRRDGAAHALLDRARPTVRVGERAGAAEAEREEDDDAVVGADEAKLARLGAGLLSHRRSIAAVSMSISSPAAVSRSGSRCVCTVLTSGTSAWIAASTCSAMSCAWSSGRSPGSFRWSATSMLPSTSSTLRLWISRTCETVSAAARTRSRSAAGALARFDVDDDVDPGKAPCSACSTRSAAA